MESQAYPARFAPFEPLSRPQHRALVTLLVVVVLFGGLVEIRSAFLRRRMTDLDVFLRAAWAVRTGGDLYSITDDNGWHYHYPPFLAIVLMPLADPPAGAERSRTVPFAVAVAIWYAFSLLALAYGTNALASALEQTSADLRLRSLPRGCQRWWALRTLPLAFCLTPIGTSLSRGQTNLLVLGLLCAMAAAVVQRRSLRAGLWLSAAICVKVMPALFILHPLLRRDLRYLGGCALGLALGLIVVPAAVFGPAQLPHVGQQWVNAVLRPAITNTGDETRTEELFTMTATGNHSILALLHNTVYAQLDRTERPAHPGRGTRIAHAAIVLVFTVITLLIGRRRVGAASEAVLMGLFGVIMLFAVPVCPLHYFAFLLPLMIGLVAVNLEHCRVPGRGAFWWLAAAFPIISALHNIPGLQVLRQFGLDTIATMALWVVGVLTVRALNAAHYGI
jgi:hypothetical protein